MCRRAVRSCAAPDRLSRAIDGAAMIERRLGEMRKEALRTKDAYTLAVEERARSQREVNDLLQRKSTWQSSDVLRCAVHCDFQGLVRSCALITRTQLH